MDRAVVNAYGAAVLDGIGRMNRAALAGAAPSIPRPHCASGSYANNGADVLAAIARKIKGEFAAAVARDRAARTDADIVAAYHAAMAERDDSACRWPERYAESPRGDSGPKQESTMTHAKTYSTKENAMRAAKNALAAENDSAQWEIAIHGATGINGRKVYRFELVPMPAPVTDTDAVRDEFERDEVAAEREGLPDVPAAILAIDPVMPAPVTADQIDVYDPGFRENFRSRADAIASARETLGYEAGLGDDFVVECHARGWVWLTREFADRVNALKAARVPTRPRLIFGRPAGGTAPAPAPAPAWLDDEFGPVVMPKQTRARTARTGQVSGKLAILVSLISRPEGASLAEICEHIPDWQEHSARARIGSDLERQRGFVVARTTEPKRGRVFRLISAPGASDAADSVAPVTDDRAVA